MEMVVQKNDRDKVSDRKLAVSRNKVYLSSQQTVLFSEDDKDESIKRFEKSDQQTLIFFYDFCQHD